MASVHYEYCPDPEDSDLVFNIQTDDIKKILVQENDLASDSDEAPDDVSFSTAKVAALSVLKAEEQFKRLTKEEQKKRRQRKEAVMKEQKVKHLQSLISKKLPDSLVHIMSAQSIQQIQSDSKKKQTTGAKSENAKQDHMRFGQEHYIPLQTGEIESPDFSVAILESKKWKNKFSKPGFSVPKDFRHKMLYGRANRRESTKDIDRFRVKQALSGKSQLVLS
uniref:Uncharacterized protein n=1 Tax=Daphnia galeata TaxID=27404 RepID=A0A8J2S4N4_9CRUS|nr:unnamed protein product [Daphnia galeata]